jgi:hypothetical protein
LSTSLDTARLYLVGCWNRWIELRETKKKTQETPSRCRIGKVEDTHSQSRENLGIATRAGNQVVSDVDLFLVVYVADKLRFLLNVDGKNDEGVAPWATEK